MSESTSQLKIGAALDGSFETTTTTVKRKIGELGTAATSTGKSLAGMGDGTAQSAQKIESATKSMIQSIQRTTAATEAGDKSTRAYQESLARIRGVDVAALKPYLDQLDAVKAKQLTAASAAKSYENSFAGIKTAAVAAGAALAGFGLAVGKLVSVQREFDVLNSSLITVTGSSANAAREMQWIKDFAKETPFGLAQATQGFVKMKALGLDPTRASLTSFGNTASAMGKDLNQMIEAVADASTGEFERLKEFGIKAKKQGDDVSLTFQGITTTIGNSATEITQYLEKLGNVEFAGAMAERAKTLDGAISELGDTWDELFRTVNTNNTGGFIYDSVTLASNAIADVTTILNAMTGAAAANNKETGAMSAIQRGIATVFETVAVVGANLKFVLVGIGNEIGGLAAQVGQAAQFNFSGVRAIREQMVADAKSARSEIDATTARILGARDAAKELASYNTRNASAQADPRRLDAVNAANAVTRAVKATTSAVKDAAKASSDAVKADIAAFEVMDKLREKSEEARREDFEKTMEAYAKASEAGVSNAIAAATAAETELANYGLLKSEVQALTLVQLEQARESAAMAGEDVANIEKRIDAQKRLIAATKGVEGNKANEEAAKLATKSAADAAAEWKKTSDSINSTLTDALMRGFESGKGFAKTMRDTIVNMFKTMVLRPVISAIMSPVSAAIGGGLGLSGAAQAAGTGSSLLSGAGALAGGASAFGGAFSAGAALGTEAFGAGVSMMTNATGLTSFMSGAGQALGAIGPEGWAAIAALAVVALASGGETRSGATYGVGSDGKAAKLEGPSGGEIASTQVRGMFDLAKSSIEGLLTGLGSKAVLTGYTAALESSENGKGFAYATGKINGVAFGDQNTYMNNRGDKTAEQAIKDYQQNLSQSILEALQVTADIPATVAKLISDGLNGSEVKAMSADAVNAILANVSKLSGEVNTFNAAMTQLPFESLKNLSFDTAAGLIAAAGGFEKLDANLGGFYQNFYTAEEQRAQSITNTSKAFEALGLTMPTLDEGARAAYRSMVELAAGQDLSVESNARAYAGLLALQGPMSQLAPTFESIAQAAVDAVAKMKAAAANATSVAVQLGLTSAIDVARDAANEAWTAFKTALPQASGFSQAEIVNFARDPSKMGALSAADQAVINTFVTAIGAWSAAQQSGSTASGGSSGTTASTAYADTLTGIKDQTADFLMQLANVGKDSYTAALQKIKTDAAAKLKELDALGGGSGGSITEASAADAYRKKGADSDAALAARLAGGSLSAYTTEMQRISDAYTAAMRGAGSATTDSTAIVNAWAEAQTKLLTAQKAEGERASLQDRLNALTDTNAQALARQRDALEASNKVLFDQVQLATAAAAAAQERKGLQDQYDTLTMTSAQLLAKQRAELSASNQALFDSINAIKAETAAREAAKTAASDAYNTLQRAVDAQRKIVQVARDAAAESVSSLTSIFDILQSSVKELYGTVDSTAQMQSDQGRAFIRDALTAAQRTGYLPESKALSDAINAAKGGTKEFASQFEKDFAALTLAGDLSLMETLTKGQLTEAQKALKAQEDQLTALDSVLTNAKLQLDAANGINTSVLSVAAALAGYNTSITALIVANGVNRPTTTTGTGGGGVLTPTSAIAGLYQSILGRAGDTGGIAFYQGLLSSGTSLADVASQIAASTEARNRVPGYAVGTNYVPNDGLAYLHEGEAVIPKAYNPMASGGNGSARTDALLEGLTKEVQRLQSIVNDGNTHARRTADTLDNVTEGGSNMRTVAL